MTTQSASCLLRTGAAVTLGAAALLGAPGASSALPGAAAASPASLAAFTVDRTLRDPRITESSGLSHSTYARGVLFTHNDSGDRPRVFAVNRDGTTRAVLTLAGATARDWEDIAGGPDHTQWLGDIGDNSRTRRFVSVYRFVEPRTLTTSTVPSTRYDLVYPDGAHNAESLLVQPMTGRVYVATKAAGGGAVYRAPVRLRTGVPNTLVKVASAPALATGGAFLPNGIGLVLRTHTRAYVYSRLGAKPAVVPLPAMKQGESVEATRDGTALLVGSEGTSSPVDRVPITAVSVINGLACTLTPKSPAASTNPYPDLQWGPGTCSVGQVAWYDVQTADDPGFTSNLNTSHSFVGRYVPASGLAVGTHYWRVRAVAPDGTTSPWAVGVSQVTAPVTVIDVPADGSIQGALDRAKAAGGGVVRLAPGATYRLTCPSESTTCLTANGDHDLRLDGRGAQLVVTSPTHGLIDLRSSCNVVLEDFTVDYSTLPYSEGRVTAVNPSQGYLDLALLHGMPDLLAAHMTAAPITWAQLLDPSMPGVLSPHAGSVTAITQVVRLANGQFRLTTALANRAKVGDIVHKQARINGLSIVLAGHAVNPALVRLTVYASPSGVVNAPESHGLVMLHNRVLVKDGRYASTDADVVHIPDADLGPYIEDNYLWGALDDFANLRPTARRITAATTTSLTLDHPEGITVGSSLTTYRYRDGATTTRTVTGITGNVITLDGTPGAGELAYPSATGSPQTVIRFNTFRGGLRYGLLLRTPNVAVEGNVFDYQHGSAVALENHPFRSNEGPVATDAHIVHNLVRHNRDADGAILTRVLKCDSDAATPCSRTTSTVSRAVTGLTLYANEIDDWSGYALNLSNTESPTATANIIGTPIQAGTPIHVVNSTSPHLAGNHLPGDPAIPTPYLPTPRQGASVGPTQ